MSETNSSAAPVAKRAVTMAEFRNKEAIAAAMLGKTTSLGQIIGSVFSSRVTINKFKDGTESENIVLTGQFECVNSTTGEIFQSGAAYLPKYFAVQVAAQLQAGEVREGGVLFAVEVVMEPNPRSKDGEGVAYQYSVINLIPPEKNDPLEALKRRLGKKLAIPSFAPGTMLEHSEDAPEPEPEPEAKPKRK